MTNAEINRITGLLSKYDTSLGVVKLYLDRNEIKKAKIEVDRFIDELDFLDAERWKQRSQLRTEG